MPTRRCGSVDCFTQVVDFWLPLHTCTPPPLPGTTSATSSEVSSLTREERTRALTIAVEPAFVEDPMVVAFRENYGV